MAERMIEIDGISLCTQAFGSPADPPLLLIAGIGSSMLWWDETLCQELADAGRHVIRYDHRDTGRSTSFPPGTPGYSGTDLVGDALRVLDGMGVDAAHLVGVSAGAAFAQVIALEHPERVRSLALISTTPVGPVDAELPPPTEEFGRVVASLSIDWSDRSSVIESSVADARVLAGPDRPFDEAGCRGLVRRDLDRADRFASMQNHGLMVHDDRTHPPLGSIDVPTLVIHGTVDPMFPLPHGRALADAIPGGRLLELRGAGHGVDRVDWPTLVPAILELTAP